LGAGAEDGGAPTGDPRSVFSRSSLRADLVLEVPRAYGASLDDWMSSAAVVAEVGDAGVIVRAHANRVFRLADLVTLIREWMEAHAVDAVFATHDGALSAIVPRAAADQLRQPPRAALT
jgi:hypothetical protein